MIYIVNRQKDNRKNFSINGKIYKKRDLRLPFIKVKGKINHKRK